jgi:hypothetical protein
VRGRAKLVSLGAALSAALPFRNRAPPPTRSLSAPHVGPAPPAAPAEETLDDPTTARLSHLQLEQIGAPHSGGNHQSRRSARCARLTRRSPLLSCAAADDEALQRAVAAVDGARDREAALAAALREPALRAFADRVLAAAAAPEPP